MIKYLVLHIVDNLVRRIDKDIDRLYIAIKIERIIIYLVLNIIDTLVRRIDEEIDRLYIAI